MNEIKNTEQAAKLMQVAYELLPDNEETRALKMKLSSCQGMAHGIVWRASPEGQFFLHDLDSPQGL